MTSLASSVEQNLLGTSEVLRPGIKAVSIVIPALNEGPSMEGLRKTLEKLEIPVGLRVNLFISDNGSDEESKSAEKKLTVNGMHVYFIDSSTHGSVGSASRVGVETAIKKFHKEFPDSFPDGHVIVRTDADIQFSGTQLLGTIDQIFSQNPRIMFAYGSVDMITSSGHVYRGPAFLENISRTFFNRHQLAVLFRRSGRRVEDFLLSSRDVFPGFLNVFRESAYTEYTSGFHDEDTTGEDIRISLELQHNLDVDQIFFSKYLKVHYSGRQFEENGILAPRKIWRNFKEVFLHGEHIPYQLERETDTDEFRGRRRNTTAHEVVADVIASIEREIYGFSEDFFVEEVLDMTGNQAIQFQRRHGDMEIRPAIHAATRNRIPGRYVVIRRKDTDPNKRQVAA